MSDNQSLFGASKTPAVASDIFGASIPPPTAISDLQRNASETFGASSSDTGSSIFESYLSPKHAKTPDNDAKTPQQIIRCGSTPTTPLNLLKLDSPIARKKFMVAGTEFVIPTRYELLKPIGHGAYGVVMYVYMGSSVYMFCLFFQGFVYRFCSCT